MLKPYPDGKAQNVVEAFGTETSFRERSDWAAVCTCGGTLLKTLICTAAHGDSAWQFGRLFVSERGMLFGAGVAWQDDDRVESRLLRWRDVQNLKHRSLSTVDSEVTISLRACGDLQLRLRLAQGGALWLAEVWRFCLRADMSKSSGRRPLKAGLPFRKSTVRRASTMTFTVPFLLESDDEKSPQRSMQRSGSDSCLPLPLEEERCGLPGQIESEPEEEASPREQRSGEGLDDQGKRLLAHWDALQDLCQVNPACEDRAWSVLSHLTDWRHFDIFEVNTLTSGSLALVGHAVLASLGFLDTLSLPDNDVHSVLQAWESGYRRDVAFHTSLHAANVTQAVYCSLAVEGVGRRMSHNVCLSMLFAAMVHDVGHPGVNNHFLVSSRDPLALCYNDRSVLENLHCSLSFELLESTGVKLLGALGKEAAESVKKRMTKIILETDMAHHKQGMVEVADLACKQDFSWDDPHAQSVLSSVIVHCHDVSNPCRPWESFVEWTNLVMEEFFHQADLERQLGLVFSGGLSRGYAPLDREMPFNVPHFQLGFARNVVHSLCSTLAAIPGIPLQCQRECLDDNIERLAEESEQWRARHPFKECSDE